MHHSRTLQYSMSLRSTIFSEHHQCSNRSHFPLSGSYNLSIPRHSCALQSFLYSCCFVDSVAIAISSSSFRLVRLRGEVRSSPNIQQKCSPLGCCCIGLPWDSELYSYLQKSSILHPYSQWVNHRLRRIHRPTRPARLLTGKTGAAALSSTTVAFEISSHRTQRETAAERHRVVGATLTNRRRSSLCDIGAAWAST
ncbi:hypothetical protein BDW71DRAFT_49398 [Aspergillus fruticulosus]